MAKFLKHLVADFITTVLIVIPLTTIGAHLVGPGGLLAGEFSPHAMSPQQLQRAYGFTSLLDSSQCHGGPCDRTGQQVAVFAKGGFNLNDVLDFNHQWHLKPAQIAVSVWDAAAHKFISVSATSQQTLGNGEAVMDIDAIHSVAPGASIHVYELPQAQTDTMEAFFAAVLGSPAFEKILSISFAGCELQVDTSALNVLDSQLQRMAG